MSDELPPPTNGNKRKGFASMTPERRAKVSRKGGKAAHKLGKAHRFTPEEASAAGRKGGTIRQALRELNQQSKPQSEGNQP